MEENAVSGAVVDAAMPVHTVLGPGLLENIYRMCLAHELRKRNVMAECEVPQPVEYDGLLIDAGYRLDMLVEGEIIVENKSVQEIAPIHEAQLLTYLKLSRHRLGFLVNWNVALIRDGIKRMVNRL